MSDQLKFCALCGAKRAPGASFCGNCGRRLAGRSPWGAGLFRRGTFWIAVIAVTSLLLIWFSLGPAPEKQDANLAVGSNGSANTVEDSRRQALERAAVGGSAGALMDLVDYYLQQSSTDPTLKSKAAHSLHLFLERFPDHPYALRLLGNIYFDLKMAKLAQQTYQRYLDQYPKDVNVRTDFGTVLLAQGKVDAAIDTYLQAIQEVPDFYNALFNLSIAYDRKGDPVQSGIYRQQAKAVEQTKGRVMPPQLDLPRLPASGDDVAGKSGSYPGGNGDSAKGELERFFRTHPIIAPKIEEYQVTGTTALLLLRNFPMESMPEAMRQSLEAKLLVALEQDKQLTNLELRDATDGRLLAAYPKQP